ncbi:MAG: DMT family transporter [Phycisphaerales bacterium]
MKMILVLLVFLIGCLQPVQAAMNAEFRHVSGEPFQAALINMYVGAAIITLILLATRTPPPSVATIMEAPKWALAGGLIGATLVTVMLVSARPLGAALLVSVFVLGQVASSTTLDHFGWLGYPLREIKPMRLAGLVMLVIGVVLVQRSS